MLSVVKMKRTTTILIDDSIWYEAKKLGLNISQFVENALIDYLSQENQQDQNKIDLIKNLVLSEFKWILDKQIENPSDFSRLDVWCRILRNRTGFFVTPNELRGILDELVKAIT